MAFDHSYPLIITFINILLTDITFPKKDWKLVFTFGEAYFLTYSFYCLYTGMPGVYGIVLWTNPVPTFLLFTLQSIVMACIQALLCVIMQRKSHFKG